MKKIHTIFLLGLMNCTIAGAQVALEQVLNTGKTGSFGNSISVSGNLAVIAAGWEHTSAANKAGAVYVYEFDGNRWVEKQRITSPQPGFDHIFGLRVVTNGKNIVITEPNAHRAHIYAKHNSLWELDTTFTVSANPSEKYGISCDIYENTVVIGCGAVFATYCSAVGSAYVYEHNGSKWTNTAKLVPSNGLTHDNFGTSISIQGTTIAVGAHRADCYTGGAGYVSIFEKEGSEWLEKQRISAPDGINGDRFGTQIDLKEDKLVVGAVGLRAAYFFEKQNEWVLKQKINSPVNPGADAFGGPVSLSNNLLLIGAHANDSSHTDQGEVFRFENHGAAYIYEYDGDTWSEKAKLFPPEPQTNQGFGITLFLHDNRAYISEYKGGWSQTQNTYIYGLEACEFQITKTVTVYDTVAVMDTTYVTVYDTTMVNVYNHITVTDTLLIDIAITALSPLESINTIRVYPNPSRDFIYIHSGNEFQQLNDHSIRIINSAGTTVFESKIDKQMFEIDISNLGKAGLYFLKIIDNSNHIMDVRKILLR